MGTLHHSLARFSRRVFLCDSSDALYHSTRASLFLSLQVLVHSFLMNSLGSPMGIIGELDGFNTRGVHLITWHCIGSNIPGAKAEAGIWIRRSLRKIEYRSRPTRHMKIPCLCPFEKISIKEKVGIWVPHVELVIPELMSKSARQIRLDCTGVTLTKNKISRSDTHQPAEDTSREGGIPIWPYDIQELVST